MLWPYAPIGIKSSDDDDDDDDAQRATAATTYALRPR